MKYLAKYMSEMMAEIVQMPESKERLEVLKDEGFLEFIPGQEPELKEGETMALSYELKNGKVYQNWTVVVDEGYYRSKIQALKDELSASDYKVIKCYEANLAGVQLPYDVELLRSQRESLRDKINEIENLLKTY